MGLTGHPVVCTLSDPHLEGHELRRQLPVRRPSAGHTAVPVGVGAGGSREHILPERRGLPTGKAGCNGSARRPLGRWDR